MDFICLLIVILIGRVHNKSKAIQKYHAAEQKEFARLDAQAVRKQMKAKYDRGER